MREVTDERMAERQKDFKFLGQALGVNDLIKVSVLTEAEIYRVLEMQTKINRIIDACHARLDREI